MTKSLSTLIILTASMFLIVSCSDSLITCTLKGKIIGLKSDTLILLKATEDIRFAQTMIPVKDSSFEYKLRIPQTEAYELVYMDQAKQGTWRPIFFFPENGVINFELYSDKDFPKNQIKGGGLTKEYLDFTKTFEDVYKPKYQPIGDSMYALMQRNEYYSSEMDSLLNRIRKTNDLDAQLKLRTAMDDLRSLGKDVSPKGKAINEQNKQLRKDANKWRYAYIKDHPSIMTFYFLIEDLKSIKYNLIDVEDVKNAYADLSNKFPNHTYTVLVKDLLLGLETIKVGGRFVDFVAPDLNGNNFKLSELIQNKVALIDLWASWCGPCIMTSRSMIPVFKEFNNKGFTICGVAAEIKNTDQLKKTLEKEKFPWLTLVELDHKNRIWDRYGISNSGGGTFLVDKDGTILAISPTADDVKKILLEKLQ